MALSAIAASLLFPLLLLTAAPEERGPQQHAFTESIPRVETAPTTTVTVTATAYTSLAAQTDSTPFITASGSTTRFGVVATNYLPFGTCVRLPELYGDQVFVVEDRMHAHYGSYRIDVWLPTNDEAKQFGAKQLAMEVL